MHRINLQAIMLASLASFGLDLVSSFLMLGLFGGPAFDSAKTDEQIQAAMQVLLQDTRYLTCALFLGTASTVLGGFLAARLAGALPYFNALAFGLFGLILSAFAVDDNLPAWFMAIGFTLTLPAALFGGYLAKQRSHRDS